MILNNCIHVKMMRLGSENHTDSREGGGGDVVLFGVSGGVPGQCECE